MLIRPQIRVHLHHIRRPQRFQDVEVGLHLLDALVAGVLHADALHDEIESGLLDLLGEEDAAVGASPDLLDELGGVADYLLLADGLVDYGAGGGFTAFAHNISRAIYNYLRGEYYWGS